MTFCTSCGTKVEGNFCQKCGKPVAKPAQAPAGLGQQAAAPPTAGFGQQAAPPPPAGFTQQAPPSGGFAQQAPPPAGFGQQAPPPPPVGTKKKMGPLGWVLIGLGAFCLLIGVLVVGAGFFVAHKVKSAGIDSELASRNPALAAAKLMVSLNPDVEVVKVDDDRGVLTIREKKTGKTITMSADDVKNGKLTFTDESTGETVALSGGANVKLPSWIPDYPGSKPESTVAATGRQGEGGIAHFTTNDSVSKVLAFYKDELKGAGFKITSQITGDSGDSNGGLISAENMDSRRTLLVTVGSSDKGTEVALTYGTKQ